MAQQKKPNKKKQSAAQAAPKKNSGELTRGQKIVVIVFIVIFAFSTLASALASVFSSSSSSSDETEETTVATIDERYEALVEDLEAKVAEDSTDTASLLALGRYYSQWGASAKSYASTDDETSHVNELFEKAVSYYDQYLELEDSDAVRVDQAMCKYYEDDTDSAITLLKSVAEDSDYPLAWYNLGYLYYYSKSDNESAKEALNAAVAADPDDEYSVKTNAESLLSTIESAEEEAAAEEDSSSSDTATSTATDTADSSTSATDTDSSTSETSED